MYILEGYRNVWLEKVVFEIQKLMLVCKIKGTLDSQDECSLRSQR